MFKSKVCFCFLLLVVSISNAFAESVTPPTASEFTYDSKRRFSCGGYALKGMVSELDGDNEIYKADTDTLVCTFSLGVQICADGKRCRCPPPEWEENGCWITYGKLREKHFEILRQTQDDSKS